MDKEILFCVCSFSSVDISLHQNEKRKKIFLLFASFLFFSTAFFSSLCIHAEMNDCVKRLRSRDYGGAVRCMERLQKAQPSSYHLRNLAFFYEEAGRASSRSGDKRDARLLWHRAVESYERFLEIESDSLPSEEKQSIQQKIQNYALLIGYSSLALRANIRGSRALITGYRYRLEQPLPFLLQRLLPGNYRIEVMREGYLSETLNLKLLPRKRIKRDIVLRADPKKREAPKVAVVAPPPPAPKLPPGPGLAPFWIALGVAALCAGTAVTTHLLARSAWEDAGTRSLRPGAGYRESYESAQLFSGLGIGFYSVTGAAGATAMGFLIWHLIAPPLEKTEETAHLPQPSSWGKTSSATLWRTEGGR